MAKKKKDFPNNFEAYRAAPSKFFEPIPFDEFMDWKMLGWEIPSSVAAIVREQDLKTGEVKEYVYNTLSGANKRCKRIMKESKSEFLVCTHDDIAHMFPTTKIKDGDSIYGHPDIGHYDDRFTDGGYDGSDY